MSSTCIKAVACVISPGKITSDNLPSLCSSEDKKRTIGKGEGRSFDAAEELCEN